MSPQLATQLDQLLLWFGFLFIVGMNILHIRSDVKMHMAHGRMINMLLDELIERKKDDVTKAIIAKYRKDVKLRLVPTDKDKVH